MVATVIVVSAGGDGDEGTWWWLRHGGDSCDYDGDGVEKDSIGVSVFPNSMRQQVPKNCSDATRGLVHWMFCLDNVGDGCDRADDKW